MAYPGDGGDSPEGGPGASNKQTHFDMQCLESKDLDEGGEDRTKFRYVRVLACTCVSAVHSRGPLGSPYLFQSRLGERGELGSGGWTLRHAAISRRD